MDGRGFRLLTELQDPCLVRVVLPMGSRIALVTHGPSLLSDA
jgi:hypothetical protein